MAKPTHYELLHGVDRPPAEFRTLRAGPLTAVLDGIDLRWVRHGSVELVRRIYAAVRDPNWGTLPNPVTGLQLDVGVDSFSVEFDVRNRRGEIDLSWHGRISGDNGGCIVYDLDAVSNTGFYFARIGLCVLHPPKETAGSRYIATGDAGDTRGVLPTDVAPQEVVDGTPIGLIPPFTALSISLAPCGELRLQFEGDLFEMEDQRNWTDGSFKTYSTPLALGQRHRADVGTRIRQRVIATAQNLPADTSEPGPVVLAVGEPTTRTLPPIGLGIASDGSALSPEAIKILRGARPDHIRTDIDLSDPPRQLQLQIERALQTCGALGCPLELALFVGKDSSPALATLAARLRPEHIARVLTFARDQRPESPTETTPPTTMALVRTQLGPALPGVPLGGGTDMYFAELNRRPPKPSQMDIIAYAVMPQVHAEDDASLFETLEAQGDTVRTALLHSAGKPVAVTPITLRHRKESYGKPEPALGALPFQVDPRQMSVLLAAWTLGSVKYCAEAGAVSLTYFETTGCRGIVESQEGSLYPELFRSYPGMVFPVRAVFTELARHKASAIVPCMSSSPLDAVGLCLVGAAGITLLAANLTPRSLTVRLETATCTPARFIAGEGSSTSSELHLGPYAVSVNDNVR